jgi:SAM-dependent methyltransferase
MLPDIMPQTDFTKLADMWSVSGQLLHTPAYRVAYADMLARAIGDTRLSILDAACGTGFPMIELYERGFRNIIGSDADPDLLTKFRTHLATMQRIADWQPLLIEASWQELPRRVAGPFDVVLNVDAAIGFMDSWMAGEMRSGAANIFARVVEVLRNFHQVTGVGGRFFIGLQKNNHKGNSYYPMEVGHMMLGDVAAEAHWNMTYDWKSRIKTWVNVIRIDGREYAQTRCSYLFDLTELGAMLKEAGFARVETLTTPDEFYEDILIAYRAP